ncbi:MAG TPA: glycosyltransferase WbuB [Gammaproteobacteria bacterium]|nr:glycosyltransferase WbuB [Gammaproteobacteria bacterium]
MHILFLTDNFPPETNAPASRTYEHAKRWVAAGHRVTVVTGAPNFPSGKLHAGYRNAFWKREVLDGIDVVRVWTYITANVGFLRRTLDYISFMMAAILASPFLPRPDVIVATSPQFFTPCAAWVVSKLRRRPFVFELRDLWPDSIIAVGAMQETWVIGWLRKLEYFLYRRAARIVSVSPSFKRILITNGIDPEKIAVVPNGVELTVYQPGPKPETLAKRLNVEGKFVAAYVGTVGMAHGIGTLLNAAKGLLHRQDIVFVVVGTGAEAADLADKSRRDGLTNVIFVGAVSKAEVREYWRLCDVALVLLRDAPLFRHVIPSKIFEAMGMARPILLGVKGESERIILESGAGITIPPEDAPALALAVGELAGNRDRCIGMGTKGRQYVEQRFSREQLATQMLGELARAAGTSNG